MEDSSDPIPGKSIVVADLEDIFTPPPGLVVGPLRRPASPIKKVTHQSSNVEDTRIPAVFSRQNDACKSSNPSTFISPNDLDHKKVVATRGVANTKNRNTSEDLLKSFDQKAEIPIITSFIIPFNLYETTPLTYGGCRRLSMPTNADEWCVAILEQRWYQSIGSKLIIGAEDFEGAVLEGLQYLQAWNRTLDPGNNILHRWAVDIVDEIKFHVAEPDKASSHNNPDGSWKHPSAIVPEMLELLPLPLDKRIKYYSQVRAMFDEVVRRFGPSPKLRKAGDPGNQGISESSDGIKAAYMSKVLAAFGEFCGEITEDAKRHFHEVYSTRELNAIEESWWDDLESERIEAEKDEAERSQTLRLMKEGKKPPKHNYGFYTGLEKYDSGYGFSLTTSHRNVRFDHEAAQKVVDSWDSDYQIDGNEFQAGSPRRPLPFQHNGQLNIPKRVPPSPIPLSDLLKPSKFDWGDEDEEEMPDIMPCSVVDQEKATVEDGSEVLSSYTELGQNNTIAERNVSSDKNDSKEPLQAAKEINVARTYRYTPLPLSNTVSSSVQKNDLDLFEDMLEGRNSSLSQNSTQNLTIEDQDARSKDESNLLIALGDDKSPEASLSNEGSQTPGQETEQERSVAWLDWLVRW